MFKNGSLRTGFRFSVLKTTCDHFHRQRIYTEPTLHLEGQPIPVKGEAKFLGVLKSLNLLLVVGHVDWGADRATLLKLYSTQVRSKLEFGLRKRNVWFGEKNLFGGPWALYIIRAFVLPSGSSE
ncbi:RNA-directed DNA polymerase from mobile element jockey [Plakobranchus ocellatus]|uniref:RNA-directed DNA polymerase from mobile element jockey n=1 Tax=Plakobranchus ocellatus TaxID=259542 RepID=A0AAV3YXD5_9GAST|nr:RNA-directed DNA polymerase from mobile element jockey [Plakobranchus ocellatus]